MKEKISLTGQLSEYIAGEKPQQLPESIVDRAKIHILDTLGAIVSGSLLKPGKLAIDFVRADGGLPQAGVIATDIRTTAVNAALANGVMAHADETDDTHFPTVTHPGSIVVPASLAIAEKQRSSGKEFITAVVLGYDVLCRISKALDRKWMQERCIHAGSISAGFGAAAAAARLLKLPAQKVRYALAFAGTQACGLTTWRDDPEHIDKALCHSGIPARNGVSAALWARGGMTATEQIFEGPNNLLNAFAETPHPEEIVRDLGAGYEITDAGIKVYPAGQPMQATLTGYFRLVQEHALQRQDISKIIVRLPESQSQTINDRHMPDINCQYLLAVAMIDGKVDFQNSHDFERMHEPQVLELKKRVEIAADIELTKIHPAVRSAIVEIMTFDGRHHKTLVDRVPGAPYNPLSPDEAEAKSHSLIAPVLGEARAHSVIQAARRLETLTDVNELAELLRT
ncbi:MAG: MmgE/PrpD family protein [Candidatus Binatia bacterium]